LKRFVSLARANAPSARNLQKRGEFSIGWVTTAVILAFCALMTLVPWERLMGGSFADRGVYLSTFSSFHPRSIAPYTGGAIAFVTNEVLWDAGVRWAAGNLNLPVEALFGAISFLCLFVFSRYLVSKHGLFSLVFLVNPLVVDFAFSQLRMALAVSLLLLAMYERARRPVSGALIVLACMIHTASFLFLFVFFAVQEAGRRLSVRKATGLTRWLALVGIGLAVVLVIGPFRTVLLSMVKDRRAAYENVSQGLLYASFWVLLDLTTAVEGGRFFENEGNALAVVFLSVFVGATAFHIYNSRFLAAAFPLIISAMLSLSPQKRTLVLPLFIAYVCAQWYYWMAAVLQ
jgi:hypothetical protein